MEQRSPEWFAARAGKVTASRIADVVAKDRSGKGWGVSRTNYAAQLIAERLTGVAVEGFSNAAMQWGTDQEPEARIAYEFYRDASVMEVGFVAHPTIADSGASPDGLVGDGGLVQFKCPNTATHLDTLLGSNIPGNYQKQMQWEMACTGRQWCDFVSFDPRMPESMRLHVDRVKRDDDMIADLEREVVAFLRELDAKVAALRTRYEPDEYLPESARLLMAG